MYPLAHEPVSLPWLTQTEHGEISICCSVIQINNEKFATSYERVLLSTSSFFRENVLAAFQEFGTAADNGTDGNVKGLNATKVGI